MAQLRICSIEGCGKKLQARGLCAAHWYHWRYYGNPHRTDFTRRGSRAEYYLSTVLPYQGDDCLTWPFHAGYAKMQYHGKQVNVHRQVCIDTYGPPPFEGAEAAHSCGNGRMGCVNPRHLSWKSCKENNADKLIHGTVQRGSRQGQSKLTDPDVRKIRSLIGKIPQKDIALMFSVSRVTITNIKQRTSWNWLD